MGHRIVLGLLATLLLLSGCASHHHDNADLKANLEPEIWDSALILKDLKRGRPLTEQEKKALASRGSIQFNLDVTENEEVQAFLQYFAVDKHGTMQRWLDRARPHLPYVRAVLASYNLPTDLIVLPFIESGYNSMAYSPVGAGGMWQFMPYTARRFGLRVDWWIDERRDPYKATVAAAKYLTKLYQMFGDWNLALAAYNAGEGKVSRAMACSGQTDFFDLARDPRLLKAETRHYVPKFLAVLKIFQNLDSLGFQKISWQAGPNLKEVSVPGGTDLRALAQSCGLSWEQFREQNAAFRRQVSPPDQSVNVYVPVDKEQRALAYLKNPQSVPASGYQTYAARDGDTWWGIARRVGMPVAELRQLNASLPEDLPPGQTIHIPNSASGAEAIAVAERPDVCAPIRAKAAAKPVRHRVARGETLPSIARRYGVGVGELMAANHLRSRHRVPTGKWLTIPGSATHNEAARQTADRQTPQTDTARHQVRKGETLATIAARYGVSQHEILAANHLRSSRELKYGRTITIPGKATASAQPAKAKPAAPAAVTTTAKSGSYVVHPGDTLSAISRSQGVDLALLMSANHLNSGNIRSGDKLILPGKGAVSAPAAALPAPRRTSATDTRANKAQPAPSQPPRGKAVAENKAPAPTADKRPTKPAAKTADNNKPQSPAATAVKQPAKPAAKPVAPNKTPAPTASADKHPSKPAGKAVRYKVNPGETVWAIAKKFNVQPDALMGWNKMKSPSSLRAGANLTIYKE